MKETLTPNETDDAAPSEAAAPSHETPAAAPSVAPETLPSPGRGGLRSTGFERRLLLRLLRRMGHPPVSVELWDGIEIGSSDEPERLRLRVRDRRTLRRCVLAPATGFGECYADGALEIEGGSLADLLRVLQSRLPLPARTLLRRGRESLRRLAIKSRSLAVARKNIYHHYDIGNEFYRLWLDDRMLYTCAYYAEPRMTLEEAQVAKMDHVCRKLQLRPGESVIEAGCGWGGFALHMARTYGVNVRAFNISHEQIEYAREAARREDLEHRVEFVEDDWRNISGRCDAFVSVGMLEHVGIENYPELGRVIRRCLQPGGRGLIHSIGRNYPAPLNAWIERNIFPGAQPPALSEMMDIFEGENFSVLDVENIRLHYAVTLRDWLDRFEERVDDVRDMFDERFIRMWRLYLASSMVSFEAGTLQLFQVLFAPGLSNRVPWTRDYQYRTDGQAERGAVWRELREGRMA